MIEECLRMKVIEKNKDRLSFSESQSLFFFDVMVRGCV